jgi:ribose/xylose/arabinose/galactoside ABC-type transport system permease subunit
VLAISGAVACTFIASSADPGSVVTVLTAIVIALAVSLMLGIWNGFLVTVVGIQPIIATLILMFTGRGIAMLITSSQIKSINSAPYKQLGSGYWLAIPVASLIAGAIFLLVAMLTRRTALGMLIESVGINPEASRLSGVRSRTITWTVYATCALFAGIAGLIASSNVMAADANNAGLFIELDAILAVVIGGTSLAGGKFYLSGTLVGALVITTLGYSVTVLGIPAAVTSLFKALVVIAICLLQAPVTQRAFAKRRVPAMVPAKAGA